MAAIANLGPGPQAAGYFFFGVADSERDAKRIAEVDQVVPQPISKRFVVGLDREARSMKEPLERFVGRIATAIQKAALPDSFKTGLMRDIDTCDYRGMHIVRITVPNVVEPVYCGDKLYVREDSSTREVVGAAQTEVARRFLR